MSKIISNTEVEQFKKDGAVLIKAKFDKSQIEKLDDLSGRMFPTLFGAS
jgi:hypothetical protein|tara:strand:+ start:290 stop:436 length:147 start_codon:yes stop_codon:yes gene_type:complete